MDTLKLYISVPVASFRVAQAREYWETYPCPPPSTVYGMLLSLVGESDRLVHKGAEIAIAMITAPAYSVVLRTLWRIKYNIEKVPQGTGSNKRPDYQELLSDVKFAVWVRKGADVAECSLLDRLECALIDPSSIRRYGGLSLGESTFLVDEVRKWRNTDSSCNARLLLQDNQGDLCLPVWPDHVGSIRTRWGQFRFDEQPALPEIPEQIAWISIIPVNDLME